MIALRFIVIALAMLLPSYAFSEDLGTLRITLIEEEAHVYAGDEEEWLDASANMPLRVGDTLWVPIGGRAELHVRGGAFIRLDEETELDVLDVGDESVRVYLEEGRLYVNSSLGKHNSVTVETQSSSISIPEGSIAMLYVSSAKTTRVSVLKGHADVESGLGKTRVTAGSSLRAGEELFAEVSAVGDPSEWEEWNRERDKDITGPFESARYLPDELDEYAYDFDGNGRWLYVKEYGYVWRPSISISLSVGWAPYRYGRWAWVGGDYVWISYERWGWVPYHYGRWAHVARIGWCWLPPRHREVYWGPGFVAWVHTPTYVAWAPLAPGEIYYGHRYYGPGSVNIVNININKTVINHYHKNVYVKNAVTVIHKDTFISGKKVNIRLKQNPFLAKKRSFGPPDMRPERHKVRNIAIKGHDNERFQKRIETHKRDNIRQSRPDITAKRAPIFQRNQKVERPTAKIARRSPNNLRNEKRHTETKRPSKPSLEKNRKGERPVAKLEDRRPDKPRNERRDIEAKRSPKPSTKESRKYERTEAKPEKRNTVMLWNAKQTQRTKEPTKVRPERTEKEKRVGKLETRRPEIQKGVLGKQLKPEPRKPKASEPQTYKNRNPKAAKPAVPATGNKERARGKDEKTVKKERGRSDQMKVFNNDRQKERKERPANLFEFKGRGRGWL